jgi:biotin carboxyl carrier protein
VRSEITGSVWKILKDPGDRLSAGENLMILESMKMEFDVETDWDGVLTVIPVEEGSHVGEGDILAIVETRP